MDKIKQAIDGYLKEHPEKGIEDVTVGIIGGLGYKPGTDDIRNSPKIQIMQYVDKIGCNTTTDLYKTTCNLIIK